MGADTCHIEQSESGDRQPGSLAYSLSTLFSTMFAETHLKGFHSGINWAWTLHSRLFSAFEPVVYFYNSLHLLDKEALFICGR